MRVMLIVSSLRIMRRSFSRAALRTHEHLWKSHNQPPAGNTDEKGTWLEDENMVEILSKLFLEELVRWHVLILRLAPH